MLCQTAGPMLDEINSPAQIGDDRFAGDPRIRDFGNSQDVVETIAQRIRLQSQNLCATQSRGRVNGFHHIRIPDGAYIALSLRDDQIRLQLD